MSEEIYKKEGVGIVVEALETNVKFKGVFDFTELYRQTRDRLVDKGYGAGGKWKFMEKLYQERHSTNQREGKSGWIWWRLSKQEEGSSYYTMHMDLDFHFRYFRDIEVMHEGKKLRVEKGEIEVVLHGYLVLDPGGEWEKHWFLKNVHELFYKRIWRKRRDSLKHTVIGDVYKIQNHLKEFFDLKQFAPPQELGFYPRGGGYQ
ncbi:hypothetical protein HYU19_00390 [Candidatus Woesearchaeota archaeon]|nr:hypothetical protein [Candidatus Woesearchaeota archaeon]